MLFYLHYILMTSGLSGTSVLLAVYFREYTDASQGEIGALLMTFPFVNLFVKPLFSSFADRRQSHRLYLIYALTFEVLGYLPFAIIPFFPELYSNHPRYAWYILVLGCYLGNCGLGVAWSLGDCLAINYAQKKGTTFGQYRLMGTVGWGVYGFIIGQINETPSLPKYIPAFFILHASLIVEILIMCLWKAEDFVMFDTIAKSVDCSDDTIGQRRQSIEFSSFVNSLPSSLGGTLRLNAHAAGLFKQETALGSDDLQRRLHVVNQQQQLQDSLKETKNSDLAIQMNSMEPSQLAAKNLATKLDGVDKEKMKNPQLILLKMIFLADGRLIKYICLFTIIGILLAPMNFTFVSIETLCSERGYNFSQLAGAILISQAAMETISFMVMPMILIYVSRSWCIAVAYLVNFAKYYFYATYYYGEDVSPYWAVITEWGLGISYAVFCTIQAEVALMFANQSRLFIPELRRRGYLSEPTPDTPKESIEAEERSIKMALRATMQAIFDGFMTGLGLGLGALICGIFIEVYSFIILWRLFFIVALAVFLIHQIIELSRCRLSDTYKPLTGTKAYEIRQLDSKPEKQATNGN